MKNYIAMVFDTDPSAKRTVAIRENNADKIAAFAEDFSFLKPKYSPVSD